MSKVDCDIAQKQPKEYWEAMLVEAKANRDKMFRELGIDNEQNY